MSDEAATPRLVFKYVSHAQHHLKILQDLQIRFTQPDDLNDPFDAMPGVTPPLSISAFVDDVIGRNASGSALVTLTPHALAKARNDLVARYTTDPDALTEAGFQRVRKVLNGTGILSLSASNANLVLWAHYASGHQGFVIGFRPGFGPLTKRPGDIAGEGELLEVKYSPERQVVSMDAVALPPDFFFLKGELWSYESEWRVVRRLAHCDAIAKDGTGDMRVHLCNIDPQAIARVDIGGFASNATSDAIMAATAPGTPLSHVAIYRARMNAGRTAFGFTRLR